MERWTFLTNHARALLCIARDPGVRLRELAAGLGITERSAHTIVADLTTAGYLVKHKHGRRNRYQIQAHLPLPEPAGLEPAIGDVLALIVGDDSGQAPISGDDQAQPLTGKTSPTGRISALQWTTPRTSCTPTATPAPPEAHD